ncbi:hypothetical protein BS17DRAFT_772724 [Gyrodon lividus]|nr:hypothetical protein BS17DRAFT_772724 [Gyrodon lividus]
MSQWGQPGFQYPMQTGFPGAQLPHQQFQPGQQMNPGAQFQQIQGGFGGQPGAPGMGAGFGGLAPQPTGFPGARPQGFQQPQQTGFTGTPGVGGGFVQAQPTGFPGAQSGFQQRPPPPPVPPLPSQFQQSAPPHPPVPQQHSSFLNPNQNRFGGPSPSSFGSPGLAAQPTGVGFVQQPTGFAGRTPASLVPQVTGFVDPRLQMMSSSFMPANISAPYTSGGAPQLAPPPQQQLGGLSLQQSFQQHNQSHGRGTTPKLPWALSKAEKKQYDQIFRAWDAQGTGFINGQNALEVFGQSGLDRNDLARIWTLADADNRGKLNLAEFHVAMGLIYRRLNGNDIPDELPHELVPPSSRDLDTSVNFLKDILKNDTRARSPSGLDTPVSRLKERSFTSSSSFTQQGGRQDATVYKHEDGEPPGGFYQPRHRHVDRSAVRSRADDASPATSDLSLIKRQLLNTQKMLDDTLANERSSDVLDRELEDLRYRITRLQEDLEYVSKGPKTTAKDEEKRRLERELVRLMHEEVPELERKVEEREAKREREKREWARDRDRRNERFGRFGDDSGRYSPASRYRDEEERPYSRGASRYDRDDRDHDRERSYRDRDADRDRELSGTTRTPPPPSSALPTNTRQPPPPPPAPARSPAPVKKNMTPEERQAFIRAEAQRRLDARKQALGVVAPSSTSVASPTLDTTIESRLAQEKKEAEERALEAEKQAEEREKQRKEKLEAEKALKESKFSSPTPTTTAPAPVPAPVPAPAPAPAPTVTTPKAAPPRPPPRNRNASRAVAALAQVPAPSPPPAPTPTIRAPVQPATTQHAPVAPEEDPEDAALRVREEALRKKREDHAALLRKLEEEEEEARKAEEAYRARRNQFLTAKAVSSASGTLNSPAPPPPPAPAASVPAPPPPAPAVVEEPEAEEAPPPPPPPPPPAPAPFVSAPAGDKPSNNPFSRFMKEGGGAAPLVSPAATANGSTNPFSRAPTTSPAAPLPPKSPGIPPPVKMTYHTAPKDSDDEWDDVMEREDDDSSDEEVGTRDRRMGLAQELFGNLLPSRPQSAGPQSMGNSAPPVPPAPPAPVAPLAPSAPLAAAATGDRNALLSAIQGGARLRKAVTNDRSGAATSGKVIGDEAAPVHINVAPCPASPPSEPVSIPSAPFMLPPSPAEPSVAPLMTQSSSLGHGKKESVDWYNGLAADVDQKHLDHLPATAEEDEEEEEEEEEEKEDTGSSVPVIEVSEHVVEDGSELMDDVDRSTEVRVRSLYLYEGQRGEDLSFAENMIIAAHPSKSGGDWWYGTMVKDGRSGFFPETYVQEVEQVHATALYAYQGSNVDELSFAEGDVLTIVDRSESDWWKAEHDGLVSIVPAAYLEVTEDASLGLAGQGQLGLELDHRQGADGDHGDRNCEIPTDIYSTPYHSPQDTRNPRAPELDVTSSVNEEDEDEDAYYSLDEDDTSDNEGETETSTDWEAREAERKRVLEAAGLIVNTDSDNDHTLPLRPIRTELVVVDDTHNATAEGAVVSRASDVKLPTSIGATSESSPRKRRPAPAAPERAHISAKDLPPIPTLDLPDDTDTNNTLLTSIDTTTTDVGKHHARRRLGHIKTTSDASNNNIHPDDAFERYEAFRKMQVSHGHPHSLAHVQGPPSANRMSVSSFDTASLAFSSPPRSPAASLTPSLREREGGESRTSQFLSFLGRHARSTTPDNDRERKITVISGPILHTPVSIYSGAGLPSGGGEPYGPAREGSPVFGSSWASLVDRSALEEIPKAERKRQEAIFELISTESDYVRDLQLVVGLFYSRLMETLDETSTATIFSNIEDILLTNTTFLSTLEERQRDCRIYVDHIGDLLERHMPNMRVYLNYCVNQANAGKVLQSMRESSPDLAAQLQSLREDPSARNLDLSSYLLVPMQRLTRYPLLIRQIMQYTDPPPPSIPAPRTPSSTPLSTSLDQFSLSPPTSTRVSPVPPQLTLSFSSDIAERQSIASALQMAEKLLEEVNETIREQEGRERLREISRELWIGLGRLDLTAPTRHLGARRLLKEGPLNKAKSGRKLRAVLCNDILVLMDEAEKGLYRVPIPVTEIQIRPAKSGRDDSLIRVHLPYPRGGDMIVLRALNVREAKAWTEAIVEAGRKAREGIMGMVGIGGGVGMH